VAKVSCGVGHSAAVSRDGTLLLWGCNMYGQCAASAGDIIDVPAQFGRSARLRLHFILFVASRACAHLCDVSHAVMAHAWMFAAVRGALRCCSK
jgi:alpha-tubulin suppressor-like RCC1 family protein